MEVVEITKQNIDGVLLVNAVFTKDDTDLLREAMKFFVDRVNNPRIYSPDDDVDMDKKKKVLKLYDEINELRSKIRPE